MRYYIDDPIPVSDIDEKIVDDESNDYAGTLNALRVYAAVAGGEIERVPGRRNGAGTPYDYVLSVPNESAAVEFYRRFLFTGPSNESFSAADLADYGIEPISE